MSIGEPEAQTLRDEIERLRELLEAQSRARRIAEAEVKRLGAELRVWQEYSALQDYELDEAARKLECAEARLAGWKRAIYETAEVWGPGSSKIVADWIAEVERRAALAAAQKEEP